MYVDPSGHDSHLKKENSYADIESKILFRGERATSTPELIFENGILPKGSHNDPLLHTKSNTTAGNFISTTSHFEIAREFAGKNGYIYICSKN